MSAFAANGDHKTPCSRCKGAILKGQYITEYATAGGDEGEGRTYWMHLSCPKTSRKSRVASIGGDS